jgi:hypothetical protein
MNVIGFGSVLPHGVLPLGNAAVTNVKTKFLGSAPPYAVRYCGHPRVDNTVPR